MVRQIKPEEKASVAKYTGVGVSLIVGQIIALTDCVCVATTVIPGHLEIGPFSGRKSVFSWSYRGRKSEPESNGGPPDQLLELN